MLDRASKGTGVPYTRSVWFSVRREHQVDSLTSSSWCPRHDTDGKGCNYVVKIKSPAQFGAVFGATGEGSLIQVAGVGPTSPSPANHGKPWTPELAEQVARAYEQGVSVEQIAEIFQRSPTSIYLKLQGMGTLTPDQVAIALGQFTGDAAGQHTQH